MIGDTHTHTNPKPQIKQSPKKPKIKKKTIDNRKDSVRH